MTRQVCPAPLPCEVFKSVEGHHSSHPLAQRTKATVHEELSAVPGQVRVGDADGDRHPAWGSKEAISHEWRHLSWVQQGPRRSHMGP